MSIGSSLRISTSALNAERLRMDVVANNVANARSTHTPEGGPFRREEVVFAAADGSPFGAILSRLARGGAGGGGAIEGGVTVAGIVDDTSTPFRRVHEPGNPDADANGDVLYPNVDMVREMTDMVSAVRSYDANATVVQNLKSMAQRALEIGNR